MRMSDQDTASAIEQRDVPIIEDMRMVWILTMAVVTVTGAQRPSDAIPSVDDAFVRLSVPVTARVSLIYKPEGGAGGPGSLVAPFEGNVTVIEQDTSLVVVDAGGSPLSGRHVVDVSGRYRQPERLLEPGPRRRRRWPRCRRRPCGS